MVGKYNTTSVLTIAVCPLARSFIFTGTALFLRTELLQYSSRNLISLGQIFSDRKKFSKVAVY